MNQIINLTPISSHIQTSYHIKEVIAQLDHLQTEIFKKQRPVLEILEREVSFPLSSSLKKLAEDEQADLTNNVHADSFFSTVRDAIGKIPVLTITLAVSPTFGLIEEINAWVINNVKGFVATDFVVDETLIAGAVIGYSGKARDYSIKKHIQGITTVSNTEISIKNIG